MVTLKSYAEMTFPNHAVRVDNDAPFYEHTTVGQMTSDEQLKTFRLTLVDSLPGSQVSIATVEATTPSIVPAGGEDRQGVADLPKRRIFATAILAGGLAGVIGGIIIGAFINLASGIILGCFVAVVVGIVSGIAGGGARFAGERAWEQANKPAEDIYLIAAYARDEREATVAANVMEQAGITDVRIVNENGAWHSPNT